MILLLTVTLPVFLVLGFGYLASWRGWITEPAIDGLMKFAQGFAIPCLLFLAIARLDLAQEFDMALLGSFYAGALAGFAAGLFGARLIFGRSWEDAVAIGFVGLFSNSLLLGLPITERAYGPDALQANFAIIALHSPFCYAVGITAMEFARAKGGSLRELPAQVLRGMGRNALILGILMGAAVNLSGLPLPEVLVEALELMARAALPAALFGLGGILHRYRPEGDMRVILYVVAVSLVLHPAVVWGLGSLVGLKVPAFRSAIITAAMAPGVNAYLFASIYGHAKRVAASAVLIGTVASVLSATIWLALLP
ncbi:AEC family transporter [Limimaricola sp. G21655-S1]|uniref:AEC family transporter n=1 Tax=unclassified Limimaricola TaxID=2626459 RepID=UPI0022AFBE1C|nr:AEC family transporter [Limimaricola sp. G21655-S1]MCZ4260537.1 AEC family transporter [Limimaricola sp. G21655-S1]